MSKGVGSICWLISDHKIEIRYPFELLRTHCKGLLFNTVSATSLFLSSMKLTHLVALNTKERIYLEDVASEPQFSSEARQSPHRSAVCLPIVSNRNQTFGAVYLASKYPFSPNTVTILTLLCEQASIGIANALLFRSVQAGTRENLKMISTQRDALEAARKSREDALKATKIKSNFLASMSHELRTPFRYICTHGD